MKIFYDTEFLEDGHTIELISIGMVAEDGRELYLVNQGIVDGSLYDRIRSHEWLMQNVIPGLPLLVNSDGQTMYRAPSPDDYPGGFVLDHRDSRIVPRALIRNAVHHFILDTPDPQLWAWYGAYDHVAYAQLFGRMIDLPDGMPMFTCDLKQRAAELGDPRVPEQAAGQHNALADARHNRTIAAFLDSVARDNQTGDSRA